VKAFVMKIVPTPDELQRFAEESQRFGFRWRCEACAHLAVSTGLCSLEYPNGHLAIQGTYVDPRGNYLFCKYFEAT
jgi:hypothetical protein